MFKRIYVELSNYCNLNCIFCTPDTKNNRMLTYEEFAHVLEEIKPYTNEICLHILGEPLIHPHFFEIVKLINKNEMKVMLSTNGLQIIKLKDMLNEIRIDTWNISLHATYQLSNESRSIFFKELLPFIDEYQSKYNATFHLRLWADSNEIIFKNNVEIKNLLFRHYEYYGEIKPRIRFRERIILAYEEEFTWPSLKTEEYSHGYCLGTKTHIGILANGEVVACCLDAKGYTSFGNIFQKSLTEILNSDVFLKTNQAFKDNKCYLELCKHCTYKRRGKKICS